MMGRSFDDVMKTSEPHNIGNTEFYSTDSCLLPGSMTTQTSNLQGPGWHGDLDYGNSNSLAVQHGSGTGMDDDSLVYAENAVPADNPVPVADYLPTPWGLVDPLLKDLSPLSRYYIHHCTSHDAFLDDYLIC